MQCARTRDERSARVPDHGKDRWRHLVVLLGPFGAAILSNIGEAIVDRMKAAYAHQNLMWLDGSEQSGGRVSLRGVRRPMVPLMTLSRVVCVVRGC